MICHQADVCTDPLQIHHHKVHLLYADPPGRLPPRPSLIPLNCLEAPSPRDASWAATEGGRQGGVRGLLDRVSRQFMGVQGGGRGGGGSGRVRMEEVHFVVVGPERAQTRSPLMAAVAIACHRICRPHHQELQAEDGTRLQISTILTRVLTGSTSDSTSFLDSPPPGAGGALKGPGATCEASRTLHWT